MVNPSKRVAIADRKIPKPTSNSTSHMKMPNLILLGFIGFAGDAASARERGV
jgi:hypothetical protein